MVEFLPDREGAELPCHGTSHCTNSAHEVMMEHARRSGHPPESPFICRIQRRIRSWNFKYKPDASVVPDPGFRSPGTGFLENFLDPEPD